MNKNGIQKQNNNENFIPYLINISSESFVPIVSI